MFVLTYIAMLSGCSDLLNVYSVTLISNSSNLQIILVCNLLHAINSAVSANYANQQLMQKMLIISQSF